MTEPTDISAAKLSSRSAIVGAMVGALVAGLAGIVVALIQGSTEEDRARVEFLREQRQTVYANFISQHISLVRTEDKWRTDPGAASSFLRQDIELIASFPQEYDEAFAAVVLVGSFEAYKSAIQVTSTHQQARSAMLDARLELAVDPALSAAAQREKIARGMDNLRTSLANSRSTAAYDGFVAAARTDLGITY